MQMTKNQKEALLEKLIRNGQKDKAVHLLGQLAAEAAKNKDFEKAEAFRDRLYEVDSMALEAIIKVNEIISNAKRKSVSPDRKRLWPQFFENLSSEEVNDFFVSLGELAVDADQPVLRQGKPNDRLFLVKSGGFKLVHENQDKEQLIHILSSGRIFGMDTFFSINVCTVSVICLSPGTLLYIERERLESLKKKNPFIENNLFKICHAEDNITKLLRQKGIDRRAYRRINLHAKVKFQVLAPESRNTLQRPITAELWDISKSGLSFYMQSKNREAVRRLIGRTLGVSIQITTTGGQTKEASLTGVVHGVQNHPLDEYSVHMKLNREFSHKSLQTLGRIAARQ